MVQNKAKTTEERKRFIANVAIIEVKEDKGDLGDKDV
jgi:hypothetical protein